MLLSVAGTSAITEGKGRSRHGDIKIKTALLQNRLRNPELQMASQKARSIISNDR